jgi:phosphate transport system permease protein
MIQSSQNEAPPLTRRVGGGLPLPDMKSSAGADMADSPRANFDEQSRNLSMSDSQRDWADGSAANDGGTDPALVGSAEPLVAEGAVLTETAPPVPGAGLKSGSGRFGDRVFFGLTAGASGFVALVVVLIAIFLLTKSLPSIVHDKVNFLTSFDWSTTPSDLRFGIAKLLWVTVIISALALVIAVPLAVGIALFTTQYAPRRLARPLAYAVDLLAAIPSIIYGIWGARVLAPELAPVQNWLTHLKFIPLFAPGFSTGTIFDGGIVLAVMVLPIVTAISRDVFERTPTANVEAALALGATRWETIRMAVLPYGRAGVISGSMLGLGRALGETLAVYVILSTTSGFNFSLFNGGETFASKIANGSAEFGVHPGPYLAAGLVLFVLTFVVNAAARWIVNRRKAFS